MMLKRLLLLLPLIISAGALPLAAQTETPDTIISPTLSAIEARGELVCGIDEEVFGFGFLNPNTGEISGIQVEFCRALAAATLGEASAVNYRLYPLEAEPAAIIDDDLDVLFHHTYIPTLARTTPSNLAVGRAAVFYDGASVMVEAGGTAADWADLDSATICAVANTPATEDFAAEMALRELSYDEVLFSTPTEMGAAFVNGQCAAQVLDRSLLEIIRASTDSPGNYVVWSPPFTRRTITPLYQYGDPVWGDIVDWTLWGLIQAEKLGISSQTIDQFTRRPAENAEDYVERVGKPAALLLDAEVGLGGSLGLSNDYMARVIRQVGNYGEIYDRYLGPESPLPLNRDVNNLWADGGLLDAPVWR